MRVFKARGALKMMGTSVFHGAFSTFLAIIVLSPSKSYIFMSFFRMWFGIIIFGVANGFVLLPVLLSVCGPLNDVVEMDSNQVSDEETEMKNIKAVKHPDMKVEIAEDDLKAKTKNIE